MDQAGLRQTFGTALTCGFVWSLMCMSHVHMFASGPPPKACASMNPVGHNAKAQTSKAPYCITVSKSTYQTGEVLQVTIKGTQAFKGVFLQTRPAGSSTAVGNYSNLPSGFKPMSCSGVNNAVSQNKRLNLKSATVSWTAPDANTTKDIQFRATLVKAQKEFWLDVTSVVIKACGTGLSTPCDTSGKATACVLSGSTTLQLHSALGFISMMFILMLKMLLTPPICRPFFYL